MVLALAGCGGAGTHRPGPRTSRAAEPHHDRVANAHPAGVSVRVGEDPQGIAVDPAAGLVAVGVHNPSRVVLLSVARPRILRSVAIAYAPRHLEFPPPAGPFLVPEEGADTLAELSEPGDRMHLFVTGAFPHDAYRVAGRLFIGDERGGDLSEYTAQGTGRTIRGFTQPGGVLDAEGLVGVVDVGAFTLTLLDPVGGQVIGRLPAGAGPTHAVSADNRVWVADTRGGRILTFSVRPFRRLGTTPVPAGPYGLAVDPAHHRLWVTETGANRLAELDVAGPLPRVIASYPTGVQPDTVAADARTGRVYVANQISGTVEYIDPDR